ncbi:MAG: hypothetical protein OXG64_03830 [Chloroflexi bacterium]|nr:hypothetical protein [Chloroflexota bacterium]
MTVDPAVVPGLSLLAAELVALAAVGFVLARVVLRQTDDWLALAQGLVVGPAFWGLLVNFVLHLLPGRAGALVGWVVILALAAGLVWRSPSARRIAARTLAGFGMAALVVFGIALTARQTLIIGDAHLHLGLAAPMQAGVWPPVLPWSPWQPAPYHYGSMLLVALLGPPVGPDLAFTTEMLDAYAWSGLALLAGAMLFQRGGRAGLFTLAPLVLTAGAWTPLLAPPPALLEIPIPAGVPSAGIRSSLGGIYGPAPSWPWPWPEPYASPPNIWFSRFTLAYGLAFVVMERVISRPRMSGWSANLLLAVLVGFLGLLEEAIALVTLGLWGVAEAGRVLQAGRARANALHVARRSLPGLVAAALLLGVGGGVITGMLVGSAGGDLALGWMAGAPNLRPLISVESRPGGLALLGLGPAFVASAAVLLMWRDRLVLGLAMGSAVCLLFSMALKSELSVPQDARLDGHAGNFALLALLVAGAGRLRELRPRWRLSVSALAIALIVWPTVVLPIRTLGLELSRGVALANAQPGSALTQPDLSSVGIGRRPIEQLAPDQLPHYISNPETLLHTRPHGALAPDLVTSYIREHTPANALILSPHPSEMTLATGRPNASGFAGLLHVEWRFGPEYADAISFLEPQAIQRLGVTYVHATDAWVAGLPKRAQAWLDDPRLFELLARDGAHALYGIEPEFLSLEVAPTPASFEALRQAAPSAALVRLKGLEPAHAIRAASVLGHTRLLGRLDRSSGIHVLTDIPTEPVGERMPNVVGVPRRFSSWVHRASGDSPVWWNDAIAVYADDDVITPVMGLWTQPQPMLGIRVSEVQTGAGGVAFTATFADQASTNAWKGQDWLVIPVDATPWALPATIESEGDTLARGTQWYAGQVVPGKGTTTFAYNFDARVPRLAVRGDDGVFANVQSSGAGLESGVWALAVRLRGDWWELALIPVLRIVVSEDGGIAYEAFEAAPRAAPVS